MVIEHPRLGMVATYGGPCDSFTVPEPDEDGSMRSERYDHDVGGWTEGGEPEPFELLTEREYNDLHDRAQARPAAPTGVPGSASEMSEVWVVQDETGLPIYCASYPEACHEHINDAINEHGIEEAKAWKVLRFGNYVFVPCRKCNSTRVAVATAPTPGES
jgi:hypothetical protein